MFGNALSGWHLVVIVFIVLLLFGAPKLPALARSLGQSMKILKHEVRSDDSTKPAATDSTADTVTPAPQADPATKSDTTGASDSTTKS